MKRRTSIVAVACALAAVTAPSTPASPAPGAVDCGDSGWLEIRPGHGPVWKLSGSVTARNVPCDRAFALIPRYMHRTSGQGGALRVNRFRCRGGPRSDATRGRFIVSCLRLHGQKRFFLDGTGGPRD
jgi:hypothetical protein